MVKVTVVNDSGEVFEQEGIGCIVSVDKGSTTASTAIGRMTSGLCINVVTLLAEVIKRGRASVDVCGVDDDDE